MRIAIDDKDKLEQFLDYLPPDRVKELRYKLSDAFYNNEDFYLIINYHSFCELPYSVFKNPRIEEARCKFNEKLKELLDFIVTNCFPVGNSNSLYKLYPEMRHSKDPKKIAFWSSEFEKLKKISEDFAGSYQDFLRTAHNEITSMNTGERVVDIKKELSNYHISFDNETAYLMVGEHISVQIPPFSNQHSVMKILFSNRKDEAVDWELVSDEIYGSTPEILGKEKRERQKQAVKDAVRAINKRVMEVCNTDSLLIKWETNSVKRLY